MTACSSIAEHCHSSTASSGSLCRSLSRCITSTGPPFILVTELSDLVKLFLTLNQSLFEDLTLCSVKFFFLFVVTFLLMTLSHKLSSLRASSTLMIKQHKCAPAHEQVVSIGLKRAICEQVVQLVEFAESNFKHSYKAKGIKGSLGK